MNISATLVKGNSKLCWGIPKFQRPNCKYKKPKLIVALKLIISIFSGLLGITLVLSLLFLYSLRKKRKENTLRDFSKNFL